MSLSLDTSFQEKGSQHVFDVTQSWICHDVQACGVVATQPWRSKESTKRFIHQIDFEILIRRYQKLFNDQFDFEIMTRYQKNVRQTV